MSDPSGPALDNRATWRQGELAHLIPTASHERLLIKASFTRPLETAPRLGVDDEAVSGSKTDRVGRFWRFDVPGLSPATEYRLQIVDADGTELCDPWSLKTLPEPGAGVERLRILAYTCEGGYDAEPREGMTYFLDMNARRRLLDRALSFSPDVVIANGDHIYYDLQTLLDKPPAISEHYRTHYLGRFGTPDVSLPMIGTPNEGIFFSACDYQIPGLYGCRLRSTPAFFVTDDHDTFENDEFDLHVATMPPWAYQEDAERSTQRCYYPEFLPDQNRPPWLPASEREGPEKGISQLYGTLRFGRLLEAVLYDCRHANDKGIHATIVDPWVEDWLVERTRAEDTLHFFHAPSFPYAYSAGKLGEWYPDILGEDGKLTTAKPKPGFQDGWFEQHQRLLAALTRQQRRAPVVVQGDLHASAVCRIDRSRDLDLSRNPLHVVLAGTIGTGDQAFPSAARGIGSTPSSLLTVEEHLQPVEKNGFSIIDVTPDRMVFNLYVWRPPQPVEEIDSLEPAFTYEVNATATPR